MDKKTLTVEELARILETAYVNTMRKCDNFDELAGDKSWRAGALAIKTAVEAPLLAEIERLKEENSVLTEHLGSSERYGRDVLGRAVKAEADLKAAQEESTRLRGALTTVAAFRPFMGTVEDMQNIAQKALAPPAGEPVEEVEG